MTVQEFKFLFGHNLKYFRVKKGWTQLRLAIEIGIERSVISGYETGRAIPLISTLLIIAMILKVEPWEFFFKRDEQCYINVFGKKQTYYYKKRVGKFI